MAPFAAALIDRYRPHAASSSARSSLIGAGLALSLEMSQVWQLTLLWGVVVGFGAGLTALVIGAIVATRWFTERRGLALGMLTASSATGQLDLPAARRLARAAATAGASRLAPTLDRARRRRRRWSLLFMADRPADLGLAPYGESGVAPPTAEPAARRRVRDARRNRRHRRVLDSRRDLLRLRPQHQRADPDAFHRAVRGLRRRRGHRRFDAGVDGRCSISSARSARAGSRTATTIAPCCSSITACAACRCSICRARPSRSTACRCSPCSTASTGSRPCRRRRA